MKKVISLLSIDRIAKNSVLTNRKEFKKEINDLRQVINYYRADVVENPFISQVNGINEILDIVDSLMIKYNISQATITAILQITRSFFGNLRRQTKRVLVDTHNQTLLKERIVWVNMLKMKLITVKQVSLLAGVGTSSVYQWLKNDNEFGMHLDKAIAFRHAKI